MTLGNKSSPLLIFKTLSSNLSVMSCLALLYWSFNWANVASWFILPTEILKTSLIDNLLIVSKSSLVPSDKSLVFLFKDDPDRNCEALCLILLSNISSSTIYLVEPVQFPLFQ